MRGRFLTVVTLTIGLSGCVSNPNTMVFGTNTTFGVSAGSGATSSPTIVVGYQRQEAVVMPLFVTKQWNKDGFVSCENGAVKPDAAKQEAKLTSDASDKAQGSSIHPCALVGTGTAAGSTERDSLSVLASFGTHGDVSANSTDAKLKGSITQYFATGLAARRLAEGTGAAAVATGEAAKASVGRWTEAQVDDEVAGRKAGREDIAKAIENNAGFADLLDEMDTAANTGKAKLFEKLCSGIGAADCAGKIRTSDALDSINAEVWPKILAVIK